MQGKSENTVFLNGGEQPVDRVRETTKEPSVFREIIGTRSVNGWLAES